MIGVTPRNKYRKHIGKFICYTCGGYAKGCHVSGEPPEAYVVVPGSRIVDRLRKLGIKP